jgi:hypothetical protein
MFIDTDSYQTSSFPATVIMESVRDRHSKKFTQETDWFSYDIISFETFLGIHPYRGKHPIYKDLDERMLHNISVFNKDVTIPAICPPFTIIPEVYRDWYKAVFEDGKRLPPPLDMQAVVTIVTKVQKVTGSNNFDIILIHQYNHDIVDYFSYNGVRCVKTNEGIYVDNKLDANVRSDAKIALTPRMNYVISATIENERLKLYNVTRGQEIEVDIAGTDLMSYHGRLYIKNGLELFEIQFIELPTSIKVAAKLITNVMDKATHIFDGVIIQDLLGAWYVLVFPETGVCYQSHLNELAGYRIVDAKFDNNVLMVVGVKNGKYDKFIMRFSPTYDSYDCRIVKDIVFTGLNFAVLDNGICVHMNHEEQIELFSNQKDAKQLKVIDDDAIKGDVKLFKDGTKTLFARDKELFSITTRK